MEAAYRSSLYATIPHWALNVSRHIWRHNAIVKNKIPDVVLIKMNQPRPRSSLAVEEPNIWGDIEASTKSLDWVAESGGQSIRAKASRCCRCRSCCYFWVVHSGRIIHLWKTIGSSEQDVVFRWVLLIVKFMFLGSRWKSIHFWPLLFCCGGGKIRVKLWTLLVG